MPARAFRPRAGKAPLFGARGDRARPRVVVSLRLAAELLQSIADGPPCGIVQDLDRALLGIECQAGQDPNPGGDPVHVVRKFLNIRVEPGWGAVGLDQERLAAGLNWTDRTRSVWRRTGPRGIPVATSQSRAVRSSLPLSTALPSGLTPRSRPSDHAVGGGPEVCGSRRPRAAPSVLATGGQLLAVGGLKATAASRSRDGETACPGVQGWPGPTVGPCQCRGPLRSCGRRQNATASTVPGSWIGPRSRVPLAASQSRTVRSCPPVTIVLPSGLMATARAAVPFVGMQKRCALSGSPAMVSHRWTRPLAASGASCHRGWSPCLQ